MLSGVAKVAGPDRTNVDLSSGNFSLIVGGENARLAPETFRKFITAVWATYFTKQDPGISIDPIAEGVKKHLVRYIGRVVNTDLGRVMREADYTMKKWAVGTERPDVAGFQDVDDLSVVHGTRYFGASRRFWFVPEQMKFRRGGDSLLFDSGGIRLHTEYLAQGVTQKAEPADIAFAEIFTEKYDEIRKKYPVYDELFEYAKLVSLAKYLKEQGVPLLWFLMANKDLVLTEDSPGVVNELAKESEHRRGVTIQGGVELGFEGQYVLDEEAVKAIETAMARQQKGAPSQTTGLGSRETVKRRPTERFSFDLGKDSYSVLPQHSLTSGKDRRGIRYQTDLALRKEGLPSLELVRYFDPKRRSSGQFGRGWRLLIPYKVRPAGERTREFLNAVIPVHMVVENLITGDEELLSFSEDHYSIAGYVPQEVSSSQVIGLFLMSDASFRLADKLGNEFWFDGGGQLTDMKFSAEHRVHYEYLREWTDAFDTPPYQVKPVGHERVAFLNVQLLKKVEVIDLVNGGHEVLAFSDAGRIAGYVPEDPEESRFKLLALRTDGSYQLVDRNDNEVSFSTDGAFEKMYTPADRKLLTSMSVGDRRIEFRYAVDGGGNVVVGKTNLFEGNDTTPMYVVNYRYDDVGRLARVERTSGHLARRDEPDGSRQLARAETP